MRVNENFRSYFIYFLSVFNVLLLGYLLRSSYVFVSEDSTCFEKIKSEMSRIPPSTYNHDKIDKDKSNFIESFFLEQGEIYKTVKNMTFDVAEIVTIVEKIEVIYYDLSKRVPKEADDIECILAKNANPPYNICLHDNDQDTFLSRGIRTNLVWEPDIQSMIKSFFDKNPDGTFLDLGANIGTHSLYAANLKKGVQVLAVEPFPKNVLRIHKSAHLNNVQDRFKVIMAPVLNKRGPVVFHETDRNIGGNGIVVKPAEVGRNKGFSCQTMLLDDITPFVKNKVAFMKMDIEAAECHAFKQADKLFSTVDIKLVVIEILYTKAEGACCFEGMLKFFSDRNYKAFPLPYQFNKTNPLDYQQWQSWTAGEVYFEKFYK